MIMKFFKENPYKINNPFQRRANTSYLHRPWEVETLQLKNNDENPGVFERNASLKKIIQI